MMYDTVPFPLSEETMINAGSYSRLKDFKECALRAKFKYVDKIPEPDRGDPPKGKAEWPNDRGSRMHDAAEAFVRGNEDELIWELQNFSTELYQARALYAQGKATTEEMWCFDNKWKPVKETNYKSTWFRVKADLTFQITPTHHAVVDYKSGKRWGNEIAHEQQKQTYAIGMFLRNPKLQKVTTELWYLDLPTEDIYPSVMIRAQAMALLKNLDARMKKMTSTVAFPPSPDKRTCRFCPYKVDRVCPHAVE